MAQSGGAEEAGSGRLLIPEVEPVGQVEDERKQLKWDSRVSTGRKGPAPAVLTIPASPPAPAVSLRRPQDPDMG